LPIYEAGAQVVSMICHQTICINQASQLFFPFLHVIKIIIDNHQTQIRPACYGRAE
jgi:hypothetical protein